MLTYSFENTGNDSLYEYLYKCIKNDILKISNDELKKIQDYWKIKNEVID